MPAEKKINSDSLKRFAAATTRAFARIQRAREKLLDNGASPVLKSQLSFDYNEPNPQENMSDGVMALLEEMKAKLVNLPTSDQFAAFGKSIENNTMEIIKNTKKINEQDARIAKLAESVERLERDQVDARRGLESKVRAVVDKARPSNSEDEFDRARRSLRLWPIEGKSQKDLYDGVNAFLSNALEIDNCGERVGKIESIVRVEDKESSLVYSEVVAVFPDQASRDFVATRGRKLAGYVNDQNKPTCGMRMEIPQGLMPTFNVLKRYGFYLRRNDGGCRNNVRFDDFKRSLLLQVKYGNNRDNEWINVYPDEAHEALRSADLKRQSRIRPLQSPGDSPPRKRRPRPQTNQQPASQTNMDLSEEEEQEITVIGKNTEKWMPPPRPRR